MSKSVIIKDNSLQFDNIHCISVFPFDELQYRTFSRFSMKNRRSKQWPHDLLQNWKTCSTSSNGRSAASSAMRAYTCKTLFGGTLFLTGDPKSGLGGWGWYLQDRQGWHAFRRAFPGDFSGVLLCWDSNFCSAPTLAHAGFLILWKWSLNSQKFSYFLHFTELILIVHRGFCFEYTIDLE